MIMSDTTAQAEWRAQAIRSLRRKRELGRHLVAFAIVIGAFWIVWAVVAVQLGGWFPWPVFPTVGWGIGLALHAWSVYGPAPRPMTEESISREERRLTRAAADDHDWRK
jgi:hypothetical protein